MSRIALNRDETFYPQVFRDTTSRSDQWAREPMPTDARASQMTPGFLRRFGHYLAYTAAATFMTIGIMTTILVTLLVGVGLLTH